ncbi:hypothetical protein MNAN1_003801 [Malassezia nana]|uniref:Ras-related protein Rab-4B n=1 Tax=Malassezia nana TaxID=180528 RepID=A0AAF0EU06_9BASI|nr:hypothetical protein MNAN1_003801 [Malassezia nana]
MDAEDVDEPYDFLIKTIVIGESGTGKSCLAHYFAQGHAPRHTTQTIGLEFVSRVVQIGDQRVKLQIWDTAGQERFRSVTRSYYRGAAVVVLVYDLTQHATFAGLGSWLDDVRALASPHVVTVLVGNKLDREADEREVPTFEASRWAAQHHVLFAETSSLTGESVDVPFVLAARAVLYGLRAGTIDLEQPDSGIAYGGEPL